MVHHLHMNALRGTVNEQDRQCTYKRKIEACLSNHRCSRIAISGTYYEYICLFLFLAQVTWHAKLMRHIMVPSVTCSPVPYFSTLSHKRHSFQEKKKNIEHMCFDSLKILS